MVPKLLQSLIIQSFVLKVLTTTFHPSIYQYLHLTDVGPYAQSSGLAQLPTVGVPMPTSAPRPRPTTSGLPAFSAFPSLSLASGMPIYESYDVVPASYQGVPTAYKEVPYEPAYRDYQEVPVAYEPYKDFREVKGANDPLKGYREVPSVTYETHHYNEIPYEGVKTSYKAIPSYEAIKPKDAQKYHEGVPKLSKQPMLPVVTKENLPETNISPGGLDSTVLNNLAIALQLLIVSNILNLPPSEDDAPGIDQEPLKSLPVSLASQKPNQHQSPLAYTPFEYEDYKMPNANFLGSSSFAEPGLGNLGSNLGAYAVPPSNTRSSMSLMSPYEALSPSSPYSDPILSSSFGSVMKSKKDFQSPYMAIMNDGRDSFPMDLF